MKKVLSVILVCAVLCGLFALTAHAEADTIAEPPESIIEKIDPALLELDGDEVISVAVDRKTMHPLTVEDMPSYVSGDRDARNKARLELAAINRGLNEDFFKELSEYADVAMRLNTITTYVVLDVKAKDVYALAACPDLIEISYMSDMKRSGFAGMTIGDADSDSEVTILDSTRIQRYKAELVDVGSISLEAADYDGDGDVTILDATGIQRTLADIV